MKHQFIQNVKPLKLDKAYTLRYIPARDDFNPIEVFKNPKHLQNIAVAECPKRAVMIIDGRKNAKWISN